MVVEPVATESDILVGKLVLVDFGEVVESSLAVLGDIPVPVVFIIISEAVKSEVCVGIVVVDSLGMVDSIET